MVGAEEVCDAAVTKAAGLRSQNSAVDGPIHKKGQFAPSFLTSSDTKMTQNVWFGRVSGVLKEGGIKGLDR